MLSTLRRTTRHRLGSITFSYIYINDLPLHVSNRARLYADDVILYSYIHSLVTVIIYKRTLTILQNGPINGK